MPEVVREVKIVIAIDTNKATYTRTIDNVYEAAQVLQKMDTTENTEELLRFMDRDE